MQPDPERMQRAFEQAEDELHYDLLDGKITQDEYNAEINAMAREWRDEAEDAARAAYEAEMERW